MQRSLPLRRRPPTRHGEPTSGSSATCCCSTLPRPATRTSTRQACSAPRCSSRPRHRNRHSRRRPGQQAGSQVQQRLLRLGVAVQPCGPAKLRKAGRAPAQWRIPQDVQPRLVRPRPHLHDDHQAIVRLQLAACAHAHQHRTSRIGRQHAPITAREAHEALNHVSVHRSAQSATTDGFRLARHTQAGVDSLHCIACAMDEQARAPRASAAAPRPAPSSCSSPGCTTLLFGRLLRWGELRRWRASYDASRETEFKPIPRFSR